MAPRFSVIASTRRGATAERPEEHDLPGFAVVAPDGSEVDFVSALDGRGEPAMEQLAARLNKLYAGRELVRCKTCGAVVTSSKPDHYPYCKTCFYVGAAHEDLGRDQLARFDALLPEGWYVGIEHTGGGCFWLAARKAHEERYYIFTDGEAGLPVDDAGERLPNGGWGYVGSQVDDDEGTPRDDNFVELFYSLQAAGGDPEFGLSDEAALALVSADIAASS